MTLREWLDEAQAKNYSLVAHSEAGVLRIMATRVTAKQVIDATDAMRLTSQIARIITLDELYAAEGKRGVIAELSDGARWVRLEPIE